MNTLVQLLPVNRGLNQVEEVNSTNRWVLVTNCLCSVRPPLVSGRDPKPMSKASGLQFFILKFSTGGGKEAINGRLIDNRILLVAFTLNCPIIAFVC